MTERDYLKEQRDRLSKVFIFLKTKGYEQKEIAVQIGSDSYEISQLKNGTRKYIPDYILDGLREHYQINPEYIRCNSDIMIDIQGTRLENLEKLVEDWDTVKKENNRYLHFTMDRNFYDFLLAVSKARLASDEGVSSLATEIKALSAIYNGKPDIQEFVLLPRNDFIEYLTDSKNAEKQLDEILDFSKMQDYLDE